MSLPLDHVIFLLCFLSKGGFTSLHLTMVKVIEYSEQQLFSSFFLHLYLAPIITTKHRDLSFMTDIKYHGPHPTPSALSIPTNLLYSNGGINTLPLQDNQ